MGYMRRPATEELTLFRSFALGLLLKGPISCVSLPRFRAMREHGGHGLLRSTGLQTHSIDGLNLTEPSFRWALQYDGGFWCDAKI